MMPIEWLEAAEVVGHVDGMLAQHLEWHHVERAFVAGSKHHRCGAAIPLRA